MSVLRFAGRRAAWAVAGCVAAAWFVGCACKPDPPHEMLFSPVAKGLAGPADNSYCYVCHINYKNEPLAKRHRDGGVGCDKCHGWSDDHCSDEDGLTPPKVMYPKEKINGSCLQCHNAMKTVDLAALNAKLAAGQKKHCTDCHGSHSLAVRTRRWDKATGKLIYDDGVRMIGKSKMTGP